MARKAATHSSLILFIFLLGIAATRPALAEPTIYFVHNDHRGAPVAMSDMSQKVVWRAQYLPFGEAIVDEDPDGDGVTVTQNARLPGQYYDEESGLYYNYYRDYDPGLGRYVQSDPIGLWGGLNTYVYVTNKPLLLIDPTGELGFLGSAAGGTIGLASSLIGSVTTGGVEALSRPETWVAASVSTAVGLISGFAGDYTAGARTAMIRSALVGGATNLTGQTAGFLSDDQACNDWQYNYPSALGSMLGAGYSGMMTRGAGQFWGGVLSWPMPVAYGRIGSELGKQ